MYMYSMCVHVLTWTCTCTCNMLPYSPQNSFYVPIYMNMDMCTFGGHALGIIWRSATSTVTCSYNVHVRDDMFLSIIVHVHVYYVTYYMHIHVHVVIVENDTHHAYMYAVQHVCTHVRMYTRTHAAPRVCTYIYTRAHVYTRVHLHNTCVWCVHIHVCVHVVHFWNS